mmetsp:Transcript_70156/g.138919  ORF Transcript_70156/g.138919 Transcript_70156/m.138919 type:complete len:290 (-) Transcript_70156:127-996(-)
MAASPMWLVVGEEGAAGIVVSLGNSRTSALLPERLSTGALIEQLEVHEKRLRFKRLSGTGPKRGWVSLDACRLLPPVKTEEETKEADPRESVEHLQRMNVQVFDMCSGGVPDQDFIELQRSRDKAKTEEERKREALEQEKMLSADEESEAWRKHMAVEEEEAAARRFAVKEKAERQRRFFEEEEQFRQKAEAEAAEVQLQRAAGSTQVIIHVNRMLKITAEIWVEQGTTLRAAKRDLAAVLSKRYSTLKLDLESLRLKCENTGIILENDDTLSGDCVELVVSRRSADGA